MDSGYDSSRFVNVSTELLDQYTCVVCHGISLRPYNIQCGHICCSQCLIRWFTNRRHYQLDRSSNEPNNNSNVQICPQCRSPVPLPLEFNNAIRQLINAWKIKCVHAPEGCPWQDVIGKEERNVIDHEKTCGYQKVECKMCQQSIRLDSLSDHESNHCVERPAECSICQESMPFKQLAIHQAVEPYHCINVIVCPNRCTLAHYDIKDNQPHSFNKFKKRKLLSSDKKQTDEQLDEQSNEQQQQQVDQHVLHCIKGIAQNKICLVARNQLARHNAVCPLFPMSCPMEQCTYTATRAQMNHHLQTAFAQHIESLQRQLTQLTKQQQQQQPKLTTGLINQNAFQFHVSSFLSVEMSDSSTFKMYDWSMSCMRTFSLRVRRYPTDESNQPDTVGLFLFYESGPLPYSVSFALVALVAQRSSNSTSAGVCRLLKHQFTDHGFGRGFPNFTNVDTLKREKCFHANQSITFGVYIAPAQWIRQAQWLLNKQLDQSGEQLDQQDELQQIDQQTEQQQQLDEQRQQEQQWNQMID